MLRWWIEDSAGQEPDLHVVVGEKSAHLRTQGTGGGMKPRVAQLFFAFYAT